MNILPKDIINHILTFLNNKDFVNCLRSSKIFNIKNYNSICKKNYLTKKYLPADIFSLIKHGIMEGIVFLVENKQYIESEDFTPLMADCKYKNKQSVNIVKFLLEHGEDPNEEIHGGLTPLFFAIKWNSSLEIIKLLIDYGAYTNRRDWSGRKPKDYIVFWQDEQKENEICKLLKNHKSPHSFY